MKIFIFSFYVCFCANCGNVIEATNKLNELNEASTDTIPPSGATSVLIVRGVMDAVGEKLLSINSLVKRSYDLQHPLPQQTGGIFRVEILYENNYSQKVDFNALVANDSDVVTHGFFELQIPVWAGIKSLRIVKNANRAVLHEFSKDEIP